MSNEQRIEIRHANIVTASGIVHNGTVRVIGRTIEYIGGQRPESAADAASWNIVDAKGSWLIPGFIDVHVHGGAGSDFMDANSEAFDTITKFHAANGTTGMLATSVTAPKENIDNLLAAARDYISKPMPYAQMLGVHLEGPFISAKWPGAQNPAYIVPPQLDWVKQWHAEHPDTIRLLTMAPESEGAFELIEWLSGQGIVAACGHTDASYETMQKAADHGLQHAVHTFNAMKPLHHRDPGTVGAVLSDDRISAEIIADGHHVHPAGIRMLTRLKPNGNLLLITDAMAAAGLGDGDYDLGGLEVVVKDGVARLKEGTSLAGSTLTMLEAFRFVMRHTDLDIVQVSKLASANPAKLLHIDHLTGDLAVGKQADMLLVTHEFDLQASWIQGRRHI